MLPYIRQSLIFWFCCCFALRRFPGGRTSPTRATSSPSQSYNQRRNIEAGMSDLQSTLKSRRERRADLVMAPGNGGEPSTTPRTPQGPPHSSSANNTPVSSRVDAGSAAAASVSASPPPAGGTVSGRVRFGGVRGGAIHGVLPRARRGARSSAGAGASAGAGGAATTPVSAGVSLFFLPPFFVLFFQVSSSRLGQLCSHLMTAAGAWQGGSIFFFFLFPRISLCAQKCSCPDILVSREYS